MKLTNGELFNCKTGLDKLLILPLPIRCSYQVAKLAKRLNEPLSALEETRVTLVKKYGTLDPKTGRTEVKKEAENYPQFAKEYNELMSIENDVTFDRVKLPEDLVIEPGYLIALEKFVITPDEWKEKA